MFQQSKEKTIIEIKDETSLDDGIGGFPKCLTLRVAITKMITNQDEALLSLGSYFGHRIYSTF